MFPPARIRTPVDTSDQSTWGAGGGGGQNLNALMNEVSFFILGALGVMVLGVNEYASEPWGIRMGTELVNGSSLNGFWVTPDQQMPITIPV